MDLQLFAVNYKDYTDKALNRCRSKTVKQIENHLEKVANPLSYISDDNPQKHNSRYVSGLQEHWLKEINNFRNQLAYIDAEIERRSNHDEAIE